MNTAEFWLVFLAQILLRGAGWLLDVTLVAFLARGASAARRALVWQLAFAGLLLLPFVLLLAPPVPILPSAVPVHQAPVLPRPPAAIPAPEPAEVTDKRTHE